MMYAAKPTAFMRWARDSDAVCSVDGAGMLVEQAAEAFFVWRGVRPRTREVIVALRARLATSE
jgi:shikimate dehydrogenase